MDFKGYEMGNGILKLLNEKNQLATACEDNFPDFIGEGVEQRQHYFFNFLFDLRGRPFKFGKLLLTT